MPYKDKIKQREYQRLWIAKRRFDFLKDKKCIKCGSNKQLEIDHIDPKTKVEHRIWSWKESKRLLELSKCQILCNKHHLEKTIEQIKNKARLRKNEN